MRRRRRTAGALALALVSLIGGLLAGLGGAGGSAGSTAAGSAGEAEVKAYADPTLAAKQVTMFGASPAEAPNETWGIGKEGTATALVRYTTSTGWTVPSTLQDAAGNPLSKFELAHPDGFKDPDPSSLAGSTTPDGSGALLGSVPESGAGGVKRLLLVREPGGAFKEVPAVPAELLPNSGEQLFGLNREPMVAALEEAGEGPHSGALVVPVDEGGSSEEAVLHWNGSEWSREAIELPEPLKREKEEGRQVEFQVLAMAASSPANAWLLARYSSGAVGLFRRHLGEGGEATAWRGVVPSTGGTPGEGLDVPPESKPLEVPSGDEAQVLTVTGEGVWIDGQRSDDQATTTVYFKPEGEDAGQVTGYWCRAPLGASVEACAGEHELPEALPSGPSRSYAWSNGSDPYGERVITGFAQGVSLRLAGSRFRRVLALGGSPGARDVGGVLGAAFSTATEGWLGQEQLPVHLTLETESNELAPWPTAFRDALVAAAPEPGVPVGPLSSEALAVGDHGEVARYKPGLGWLPETLLGPGGRRETPTLRAVAWPTPERAYAVGNLGKMWLWRGETGLWEPDPATPLNFRGNLLGIAFDPNNPARGYAVGQGGVLLSYGKTWTQEPAEALPAAVVGASFTAIAFSGSQAIVSYRKLINPDQNSYEAGLLVNSGSGWEIDQGAAALIGSGVPWAVAGLPDGGAAFASEQDGITQIFERESASASWQATPVHFPGSRPGSLALFREGGALRVITSGVAPETYFQDSEQPAPPGFPPTLIPPYELPTSSSQTVFRQTAAGWSDQEHEIDNTREPPGQFAYYDTVYQPDPVAAVLINESGSEGWAVGGSVEAHAALDTADVYRYPADGAVPDGVGTAPLTSDSSTNAVFALGGGAQCAAPCAALANAKIGPDVWLSAALARAREIPGLRAFLYAGPRVTDGAVVGTEQIPIAYGFEQERYAQVLGSGGETVFPASSPTDLDENHSEERFTNAFTGLPFPGACLASEPGCQTDYYAEAEGRGQVRVIVLDGAAEVGANQLVWLAGELKGAEGEDEAAIVLGNADLPALKAAGGAAGAAAQRVAEVLAAYHASAYLFYAPEQNLQTVIQTGSGSVPAFGTGTLGYIYYGHQEEQDFIGASGFLQIEVDLANLDHSTVAPVTAKLIPSIGELAIEAQDGTLLRRSEAALFTALARRPRAGNREHNAGSAGEHETSPYIPIPSECVGVDCAEGLLPQYEFISSNPRVGNFVKRNTASAESHAVLVGANGKPEADPQSGLFCAFNPGTTTITVKAGGLSYSLPVTVQAGSARKPCETVPAENAAHSTEVAGPPAPAPSPTPTGPAPASAPPVVPLPPAPVATTPAAKPRPAPPTTNFFIVPPLVSFIPAFVPPPLPTPARPTPPSGTSAVTSPVEAAQREEEEEAAPESVSNEAVAYRQTEHEPSPAYLLGLVLLAAFAGASLRRRGGGRREVRVAPATITAMRAERRNSRSGPLP